MLKKAQTDMSHTDFAVNMSHVTKTFTQWQRDNTGMGLIRNLINRRVVQGLGLWAAEPIHPREFPGGKTAGNGLSRFWKPGWRK